MSILVALTCPTCAVVAVDSRQITTANTTDDTREKSFKLEYSGRAVIGGFVGLLDAGSRSIRACVDDAWQNAKTLHDFAAGCGAEMKKALQGCTIGTTLVLVGSKDLDGRGRAEIWEVAVEPIGGQMTERIVPISQYDHTRGDPNAMAAVSGIKGWRTTPDKLRIDADARILAGIDNAGLYQGITSCGGDPRSQILLTTGS